MNWKHYLVPVLATPCFAIALITEDARISNWIIAAAVIPLIGYMLLARPLNLLHILFIAIPLSAPMRGDTGFVIGFPSELLLALLAAFFLLSSLLKREVPLTILKHPLVILLLIEVAWMFVCSMFSADPIISFKRVFVRILFIYLFTIIGAWCYLKKDQRYHWIFLLYAIGLIWPVIHSVLFHARFDFSRAAAYMMTLPFFTDHTIYGAAIIYVLPMLIILSLGQNIFRLKPHYYAGVLLLTIFLIFAEVLSFSRAAWISGLIAGIFAILLYYRVRFRTILLSLAVLGGITFAYSDSLYETVSKNEAISNKGDIGDHILSVTNVQSDASNTERINRWICAWKMANDRPLTGFGPGMYQFEYGRFQERQHMTRISTFRGNRGHAHSEFMTQLAETGFAGLLVFALLVFSVIAYGMKIVYRETELKSKLLVTGVLLGLITFYVHGLFNAFLDSDKMAALVFSSIAILVAHDIRQKQNGTARR